MNWVKKLLEVLQEFENNRSYGIYNPDIFRKVKSDLIELSPYVFPTIMANLINKLHHSRPAESSSNFEEIKAIDLSELFNKTNAKIRELERNNPIDLHQVDGVTREIIKLLNIHHYKDSKSINIIARNYEEFKKSAEVYRGRFDKVPAFNQLLTNLVDLCEYLTNAVEEKNQELSEIDRFGPYNFRIKRTVWK